MTLSRDTLKAMYQRCEPSLQIDPAGELWVDLDRPDEEGRTPRGASVVREMVDAVYFGKKYILFSALVGTGKTTCLQQVKALLEGNKYFVVYMDSEVLWRFDLGVALASETLLLLMLHEAERALLVSAKVSIEREKQFRKVFRWLLGDAPYDQSLSDGELSADLPRDGDLSRQIKKVVATRPAAFLNRIADAFQELDALARSTEEHSGGLVVIVDGLEKLGPAGTTKEDWGRHIHHYTQLYSGDQLRLPIPAIYTIPPAIQRERSDGGERIILRMIKVRGRDQQLYRRGHEALREMILRRVSAPQFETLLGSSRVEEALERLFDLSGGHPRLLLILVQALIQRAASERGTEAAEMLSWRAFEEVLQRASHPYAERLTMYGGEMIRYLEHVRTTGSVIARHDQDEILFARATTASMLFAYENGMPCFWRLNPLVERVLHTLLAQLPDTP